MITIDTSAVVTMYDRTDPRHEDVVAEMKKDGGPFVLPIPILAEITYVIDVSLGSRWVETFLASLAHGEVALDCCDGDFTRALSLVARYRDLPLGYADAAVIVCAERHGGKVLTLDRRHFEVVERAGTIQVLP